MDLIAILTKMYGHEHHFHNAAGTIGGWIQRLGNLHLIFLHFPIALLLSAAIADLLFIWFRKPLFFEASRSMLLFGAFSAIPTVLTGMALAYGSHYEGILATFFWLHFFLGIGITLLAFFALILRERHRKNKIETLKGYYLCMALLFITVNATGFFGGMMTFGIDFFST